MYVPPTSVWIAAAISLLLKGARASPIPPNAIRTSESTSSSLLSGRRIPAAIQWHTEGHTPAIHSTAEAHPISHTLEVDSLLDATSSIHIPPSKTKTISKRANPGPPTTPSPVSLPSPKIILASSSPPSATPTPSPPSFKQFINPSLPPRPPPIRVFSQRPDPHYAKDFDPTVCQRHNDGSEWTPKNSDPHKYGYGMPSVGGFLWNTEDCARFFGKVGNGWYDGGSIGEGKKGDRARGGRDDEPKKPFGTEPGHDKYKDLDRDVERWEPEQKDWRDGLEVPKAGELEVGEGRREW
ncbi:MAG: hypothetical protein Q9204_007570 [Flavoplaca sp. TL-2023a]